MSARVSSCLGHDFSDRNREGHHRSPRERSGESLRTAPDQTEIRVWERTAELLKVIETLKLELSDQRRLAEDAERRALQAEESRRTLEVLRNCVGQGIAITGAPDVSIRMSGRNGRQLTGHSRDDRALFAETHDAIIITTPKGKFVDFNQAWLDLFGYTREEAIRLNAEAMYIHPEDLHRFQREVEREGSVREYGVKMSSKRGNEMYCLVSSTVLRSADGDVLGYQTIIHDITELKRADRALRQLNGRLVRSQDEERRRLARDLHDGTAPLLTGLSMNLAVLEGSAHRLDPRARRALTECVALTKQGAVEVRTISYLLHPPLLEELGLTSGISWYAKGFAQRSGIEVELDLPPMSVRFPHHVELALFRVVQESLANVHRHSGSSTARIGLIRGSEQTTLEVSDRGRGIAKEMLSKTDGTSGAVGVGIAGMQERLEQLGGRLEIDSDCQGTTVRAIVPLYEEWL